VMKTLEKKLANKKPSPIIPSDEKFADHPAGQKTFERSTNSERIERLMQIKVARVEKRKQEKVLFLSIGLCLSLLLILGAFEWKTFTDESMVTMNGPSAHFEDLIDVP